MTGYGQQIDVTPGSATIAVALPEKNYAVWNSDRGFRDEEQWGYADRVSDAGVFVTPRNSLGHPAVWQAITRISADVAKLPISLYRIDGDNVGKLAKSHPAQKLMRRPNREMNWFTLWQRVMYQRLLYNRGYVYIERDNAGRLRQLIPLLSDRTFCDRSVNGELRVITEATGDGKPRLVELRLDEVLAFEGIMIDGVQPEDFILHARNAIGLALSSLGFAARFFKRGGRVGGTLEIPAATTKKSADNLDEGFRKLYERPDAAFSTVILRDNAKFHAAQASMRETQMVEARREDVRDVARYFNIAPTKLGEDSAASYGSKYEDNRDYLDTTLSPHLVAISAELGFKLLTDRESGRYYFEHATDRLLVMNPLEQAQRLATLKQAEIISTNEGRGVIDLGAVEGGDQIRNPNTTSGNSDPVAPNEPAGPDQERIAAGINRVAAQAHNAVVRVIASKAGRACASLSKLSDWTVQQLPSELHKLREATAPHAELLKLMGASLAFDPESRIAAIADDLKNPSLAQEADLRNAVTLGISKHLAKVS